MAQINSQFNPQFTIEQNRAMYLITTIFLFFPQFPLLFSFYYTNSWNLFFAIILGTFLGLISSIYVSTHILEQSKIPYSTIIFFVIPAILAELYLLPTISYPFQTELFFISISYIPTLGILTLWNLTAYKTEIAFRKNKDNLILEVKYFRNFNVKNETFKIENGSNVRIKKSNYILPSNWSTSSFNYILVLETKQIIPIMPFNQTGLEVMGKIQSIFADTNCTVTCDARICRSPNLFLRILYPQPANLRREDQNKNNNRVELNLGDVISNRSKYKLVKPTSNSKIILSIFVGVLILSFIAILMILPIAGVIVTYQEGEYPITVFLLILVLIVLSIVSMVFFKLIFTPILLVFGKPKIINQNNSVELYSELFSVKSSKIIVPKVLNPYLTESGENVYLEFQEFHIKYKVRIAKNLLIKEYQLLR